MPARELLTHLYVLVPVLDDEKHYCVGDDEVEKLLRHGDGLAGGAPRAGGDRPPLPRAPAQPRARRARAAVVEEDAPEAAPSSPSARSRRRSSGR